MPPRIHVIHNPERKDRYELLQKEIAEQGLEVQLWHSIKSDTPKKGISLAHKQIVRWAKQEGLAEAVIGEDDLHFTHPNGAWEYYLSKKPLDYDLYLAGIMWGRILPNNTTSDFAGLNLYHIHQRYYDKFLDSDETRDIDRAQIRQGIFYVCNPMCVIQHQTISDNRRQVIHNNAKLYFDKKLYDGTNG